MQTRTCVLTRAAAPSRCPIRHADFTIVGQVCYPNNGNGRDRLIGGTDAATPTPPIRVGAAANQPASCPVERQKPLRQWRPARTRANAHGTGNQGIGVVGLCAAHHLKSLGLKNNRAGISQAGYLPRGAMGRSRQSNISWSFQFAGTIAENSGRPSRPPFA
jgi:hypothetical protein